MSINLGAVLIRTPAHGRVVIVYSADAAAHAHRDWPDAVAFTPAAAAALGLPARAHLATVLAVARQIPGAVIVGFRPQTAAAEAA